MHATPTRTTINLCGFWAGYTELYASLGLQQLRHPSGSSDVLEIVRTLKKALQPSGGGGDGGGDGGAATTAPPQVLLHCESGAFAAAVASAFLSDIEKVDEQAAASRVVDRIGGRLPCDKSECIRLGRLVCELSGGGGGRGGSKKGKQQQQQASKPVIAAGGGDDSEDDSEAEEAARAEAERAERWANYQRAVAQHGLPQANSKKPVVGWPGEGDGWTEVSHTQQSYAAKRPVQASSYAAAAKQAQAKADAEAREAERMSEKQRKNRRKAEKAKEESARREAEQKARLAETIRQRAMS